MKVTFYQNLITYMSHPPRRQTVFVFLCRWLPRLIAGCYLCALLFLAVMRNEAVWRFALCPAVTFVAATALRHFLNFPRPYEVYPLTPLLSAKRTGHSFPSRHTVSAVIIAMAFWYLWLPLGVLFALAALTVGFCRVAAGLHFVRDVLAAVLLAVLCGLVGFFWI